MARVGADSKPAPPCAARREGPDPRPDQPQRRSAHCVSERERRRRAPPSRAGAAGQPPLWGGDEPRGERHGAGVSGERRAPRAGASPPSPPAPPPPARLRFRSDGWAEWSAKPPLRKQARDAESGAREGGCEARSWHATDVYAFLNTNPRTPALAKSLCSPSLLLSPPAPSQCHSHKFMQGYQNALSAVSPADAPSLDHYPCEWGLCGAAGRAGGVRQVLRSGSRQGPGCGRATA